jgi:AraC-like DNA-binding protein
LASHPDTPIDLVFGANDRTAIGARKAFQEHFAGFSSEKGCQRELPLFCGIDGLPGPDGGIRLVRDSVLEASYIYPTYGDRLLQLAVDILDHKPYQKEIRMQSAIVTRDNARVLLMQTEETMRQGEYLDQLHDKADNYLHQLDTQRIILLLACGVIVLLLVVFVLFYLYHLGKVNLRRERVVNTLWNMKPEETPTTSFFISRFKEVIEARLENSELSVEDLAADMNLSRVQLYRKVKSITGSTPVELLRTARLNRAYQLLLTSDRSVSEVAYLVGFTAPSYFTKCFKEEYGMLPGEVRNQ